MLPEPDLFPFLVLGTPLEQIGLLLEEVGHAAAPLPFLSTIVPALTLAEAGSETQRQALLPRVARGESERTA